MAVKAYTNTEPFEETVCIVSNGESPAQLLFDLSLLHWYMAILSANPRESFHLTAVNPQKWAEYIVAYGMLVWRCQPNLARPFSGTDVARPVTSVPENGRARLGRQHQTNGMRHGNFVLLSLSLHFHLICRPFKIVEVASPNETRSLFCFICHFVNCGNYIFGI